MKSNLIIQVLRGTNDEKNNIIIEKFAEFF